MPLGAIRFQPEVRARDERLVQVLGIVDRCAEQQVDRTVRLRAEPVDVLGDERVLAVRHAALPQAALALVGRGHLDGPPWRGPRPPRAPATAGCAGSPAPPPAPPPR